MIYHVTTAQAWQAAQEKGFYKAASSATEGFIHLSKKEQVAGVLERYYKNTPGLVLLHVEEHQLKATLKYELSPSVNDTFPHLYGQLNLDAVAEVTAII